MSRVDRTLIARIPSREGEELVVHVFRNRDHLDLVSISKLKAQPDGRTREQLGVVFGRAELDQVIAALTTAQHTDPIPRRTPPEGHR
jgi:hypothetical protein